MSITKPLRSPTTWHIRIRLVLELDSFDLSAIDYMVELQSGLSKNGWPLTLATSDTSDTSDTIVQILQILHIVQIVQFVQQVQIVHLS